MQAYRVSRLKQLTAQSPPPLLTSQYYPYQPPPLRREFFGRALRPGQHYVVLGNASASLCAQVEGLVRDMNLMFDSRGRALLRKSGKLTPTLDRQLDEMAKDKALAKLLWASEFGAVMDPPQPGAGVWCRLG